MGTATCIRRKKRHQPAEPRVILRRKGRADRLHVSCLLSQAPLLLHKCVKEGKPKRLSLLVGFRGHVLSSKSHYDGRVALAQLNGDAEDLVQLPPLW